MGQTFLSTIPVLNPAGPVALAERSVIFTAFALSAIVVVPVFVLLFYFAWKYRATRENAHTRHEPDWDHDSLLAEFSWWLVPAIIIFCLGIVMWRSSRALDPYVPLKSDVSPLEVQVVALNWKWLFIYPQLGVASVNLLEFPANVPVHFSLTADAPMNSFWIPALGGQIMVMPGMQTQLNLMASRTGDFNGYSANISGEGFADMAFKARAVTSDEFAQWLHQARMRTLLTQSAYAKLALPSSNVPAAQYLLSDRNLYTDIMQQFSAPLRSHMHMP